MTCTVSSVTTSTPSYFLIFFYTLHKVNAPEEFGKGMDYKLNLSSVF